MASFSGSSQLVTHDVKIHTHHTASISSSACAPPSSVKLPISRCESCVTANTNTRSKNSSMLVTRWWPWAPVGAGRR